MTGPVWYYAQGDTEKGPLTTAQMKAMAAAGKVRRDDFVWRQGMDTWSPAREIADLFPNESTSDAADGETIVELKEATIRTHQAQLRAASPLPLLGKSLLAVGLLTLLLARGCDSLAARNISRLKAIPVARQRQFEGDWARERQRIARELGAAAANASPTGSSVDALRQELEQINQNNRAQMTELEAGPWNQMRIAAAAAESDNHIWRYWREAAFLAGSISLAAGLLMIAFTAPGPDRWLCLGMICAILFGLFLSGLGT